LSLVHFDVIYFLVTPLVVALSGCNDLQMYSGIGANVVIFSCLPSLNVVLLSRELGELIFSVTGFWRRMSCAVKIFQSYKRAIVDPTTVQVRWSATDGCLLCVADRQ
jgi:hypothetical protein